MQVAKRRVPSRGALEWILGKGRMRKQMLTKSILIGLLALMVPAVASAQSWPDYRRDRDNGRYDQRHLRDSIHRLDRLAKDFERDLDRTLDRSRADGTRREDMINNEARQFREAVGDLKSSFGNGRDLNRSRDEAQRVMQEAHQLDRIARARRINQTGARWNQIGQELRIISDAYGLNNYGYNDDIYRRDRNRRDSGVYRRPNPNNDNPWWRRIPGFPY